MKKETLLTHLHPCFFLSALLFQKEIKAKTEMSWVNATEIDKEADIFKQKSQVSIIY